MLNKTSSEYILETSKEYSIYVCQTRAIPSAIDGLKDSQRKALWILRNKGDKIKTVSLAGEMISSGLYVHSDQSASGAISMLAAPYCNNITLIDGIGTFGTRTATTEWAAPRYTYVKKNNITEKIVYPDLNIIPLKDNYDGSAKEPEFFLPLFPLVLLNGVSGIAVGWSTEILPRNFHDLIDTTSKVLKNEDFDKLIPSYDKYQVGVSHHQDNIWIISGKLTIEDSTTVRVAELPVDMPIEKFRDRLNTLEDEGTINSYVDRSTKNIDIAIKFQRSNLKNYTEEQLYDILKLRQRKTERIVVVDWDGKSIKQYETAEQLVRDFAVWRLGWFTTRYETKLKDDQYELNYWNAIKECFDSALPTRLSKKNNRKEIIEDIRDITKDIDLDDTQLYRITDLPTHRWAKDAYEDVLKNIDRLTVNIKKYNEILKSPTKLKNIYLGELEELKKLKV